MTAVEIIIKIIKRNLDLYSKCEKAYSDNIPYMIYPYRSSALMAINNLMENVDYFLNDETKKEITDKLEELIPTKCPKEGEFIAYKKCISIKNKVIYWYDNTIYTRIVKLKIPSDAKRSSFVDNKCRCNKAEIIDIYNPYTHKHCKKARSYHDNSFIYEVGKVIEIEDFDETRWHTCSNGIHFFMTEEEAFNYNLC